MKDWQSWALPILTTLTPILVAAVLKLSNNIAILFERSSRHDQEIQKERDRNDQQDQRIGAQDIMLAKIDSKLDALLRRSEQHQP